VLNANPILPEGRDVSPVFAANAGTHVVANRTNATSRPIIFDIFFMMFSFRESIYDTMDVSFFLNRFLNGHSVSGFEKALSIGTA
jgi:hypothetical protein